MVSIIRSVVQLGNKSFTITLPINWIKRNRLKKKSQVKVIDEGTGLLISTDKSQSNNKITLKLDNYTEEKLYKTVLMYYRNGFKTLTIVINDDGRVSISHLKHFLKRLWGIDYSVLAKKIIVTPVVKEEWARSFLKKGLFTLIDMASSKCNQDVSKSNQRLFYMSEYVYRLLNTEINMPNNDVLTVVKRCNLITQIGSCIERIRINGGEIELSSYLRRLYKIVYNSIDDSDLFIALEKEAQGRLPEVNEDLYLLKTLFKEYVF